MLIMLLILIERPLNKFLLTGDFNIGETDPIMSKFLFKNDSKNLVQQKTCFKSNNNPSCIDLFVTNSPRSFLKYNNFCKWFI